MVEEAMGIIMHLTDNCVKFVARTHESDYVKFQKSSQCSWNIGRIGRRQLIQLTSGCILHYGCIQHELMHTLGFYHEQSRLDRDDYVLINWDNIATEDKGQFEKRTGKTYGLPYDYQSVMHYELKAFAKDPNFPTLIPKVKGMKMGQNENLTPLDLARIYKRFNCNVPTGRQFVSKLGECRDSATLASTTSGDQDITASTARSTRKTQQEFRTTPISDATPLLVSPSVPKQLQDIRDRRFDPDGYVYSVPIRPEVAWTTEQCNRQRSDHCTPWFFGSDCNPANLYYEFTCYRATTQVEMERIIEAMSRPPVRYILAQLPDSEYLTDELLQPVAEQIIQFAFSYLNTTRATDKLRDMKLTNMLEFQGSYCMEDLVIRRTDFTTSLKLRILGFFRCGIASLEADSFSYLEDLRVVTLDMFNLVDFSQKKRIYCDRAFAWYRAWISANPYLIQNRTEGSVYSVTGGLKNMPYTQNHLFRPVNCSA
ncbi:zinc metalloproteinase nas-14-like [Paramacrobiotus metropolitanus]|uniref:zinc metalloproteinase nas-14-like n=1 Tax=Paramacrobiotus metropolitanus TaxID=2943436 RepID=UPI002445DD6C|nr:zinc metalloproteinase nas-14-like [Paramacrobiotus metropolitanus]